MKILQLLRRLGQKMTGWNKAMSEQDFQFEQSIKKLYYNNGLKLVLTCEACPEQYEVFNKDNKQVGYLRLRHGEFRVDYPDCGGETIYEAQPDGDGIFETYERRKYMKDAMNAILLKLNT